jgi:hypothetical protein
MGFSMTFLEYLVLQIVGKNWPPFFKAVAVYYPAIFLPTLNSVVVCLNPQLGSHIYKFPFYTQLAHILPA